MAAAAAAGSGAARSPEEAERVGELINKVF